MRTKPSYLDPLVSRSSSFSLHYIVNAFNLLLACALPKGYRFCFCIDGLDEYGEDGLDPDIDYADLANRLSKWAADDNIKILTSSRPEFDRYFPQTTRQVELHKLTAQDIRNCTRNLLLQHQDFHLSQDDRETLCSYVVTKANGVFLWATIATRSLYSAVAKYESILSMIRTLDGLPRKMSEFYEKLLGQLSDSDWIQACKLLTYRAFRPYGQPLLPIDVSWPEHWDNTEFPAALGPPTPYEPAETTARFKIANVRLQSPTKGLMECQEVRHFS